MIWPTLLLLLLAAEKPASPAPPGAIAGMVVNGSSGDQPTPQAEVALRAKTDGPWLVVAETKTNERGVFYFEKLPLGPQVQYQAGANFDGVHYPGPVVRLTAAQPRETVKLTVHSAQSQPSPLSARNFEITLAPDASVLQVAEKLSIVNPGKRTYVGLAPAGSDEPVTLQLAVPPQFDRTTFNKEFFGRRFAMFHDKLTTTVPWPPGERELAYRYTLRYPDWNGQWRRPLDLPCSRVRVTIRTAQPDEVSCNLPRVAGSAAGEVVFESSGQDLPAGHVLRVTVGHATAPWMRTGRIVAAVALALLIAGAGFIALRRRRAPGA